MYIYIYHISAIRTIFFGVVSIAQSVEVTDSAVLGGVAEVVSSNPSWAMGVFFSIFRHSLFIISLYINLHYKSVSVSDPM